MKANITLFIVVSSILLGSLYLTSLPNSPAIALEPTPSDDEVNAIAHDLFCPVCENISLDVCDTEACRQWRDLIRQMLAEGKTAEEIKQYFSENYGVRVLAEPPVEGFNWLAYLVPPLAFLIGAFLLLRAFRIWKVNSKEAESLVETDTSQDEINDVYTERFEKESNRHK